MYGKQCGRWPTAAAAKIDQIRCGIDEIRRTRIRAAFVNRLNVADLPAMALQPCHALFQFTW